MKNADTAVLKEAFEALSKSAAMVAAALRAESAADAEAKPQLKEEKLSVSEENLPAEKVRGMLAAKAAGGFKAEVKQIVNRFGKNFTASSPEDYPAVVEELSKLTEKAAGNE